MKVQVGKLASRQVVQWGLSFVGVTLAVVGYFGPWIPHKTAALTVTGSELSWFAKPFARVTRELFVLPLIAAAVILGLVAQRLVTRPLARLGVVVFGLLVILASTPVYDSIASPEYRGQLILMVVGGVLVVLTLFAPRLPRRVWDRSCRWCWLGFFRRCGNSQLFVPAWPRFTTTSLAWGGGSSSA
jgi:hypothetical protein